MTARLLRRAAAMVAVGSVVLLGAVVAPWAASATPRQAQAQAQTQAQTQAPNAETTAVENYGACLAAQRDGDLLILIDESGSLNTSDREGARITAATYLLQRLSDFTRTSGVRLDVAVAGFAGDFDVSTPWTTLDAAGLPTLTEGVEAFRNRNNGFETDYWIALEGARRALSDREGAGAEAQRCQALAWFSDGALDYEPRDTAAKRDRYGVTKPFADGVEITSTDAAEQVEAAATQSLCRDGGLADQLRSSGVVTFGIGLAAGGATAADFDLMRSITTGGQAAGGQAAACGAVVDPAPGEFHLASDIDGLLFAFDELSTPGRPPLQRDKGICQRTACADHQHRFVLDSSIELVHILGSVDRPNIAAQLIPPSGVVLPLDVKTIGRTTQPAVDGVTVSYSWQSDRTLAIDLTQGTGAGWTGVWALVFVDPAAASPDGSSRSNIHISGNLLPAWANQPDTELRSEEKATAVVLGIVDTERTVVDPSSILGALSLSAVLVGPDGAQTPVATGLDKTELATPTEIDLTAVPPGSATLRLTLGVTTAPARAPDGSTEPGTVLAPQNVDLPVQVLPPLGYPTVAGRINFGTADGVTELTAQLPVTGPGCVWVDDAAAPTFGSSPDGAGRIALTAPSAASANECRAVPEGTAGTLELRLSTEQVGNGTASGTLPVSIAPIGEPDRARTVDVTFTADLRKPLQAWNFALALVAALVLGPGIPVGLLYLGKWLTARIPARPLSARLIPVHVAGGLVMRDGAPFAVRDTDFVDLVPIPARGARRLDVGGVGLRSRIGRSPLGAGFVTVRGATGTVAASSGKPAWYGADLEGRLPLAVHNTWVVLHHPAGPPDQATALLLVGGETSPEQRAALANDVVQRLPDVLARLREAASARGMVPPGTAHAMSAPASPFGSPTAAAPGASPFTFPGPPPSDRPYR